MKLQAIDGEFSVLNCHDLAVIGLRGDLQAVRHGLRIGREGMISCNGGLCGQSAEHPCACIKRDRGLLAVHELLCVDDRRAVCGTDRLMSEADAENRDLAAELLYDFDDDACILRTPRAGGEDDLRRGELFDLRNGHLIIPDDFDLICEFAEILIEIIGKAVIIINQQNHLSASCSFSARTTAAALLMHS